MFQITIIVVFQILVLFQGRWCSLTNIFGYLLQMDPKFLRNQRYAKKHNRVAGVEEEEEET